MPDGTPGHLLVVDDSELNRDMLSRRLLRQGYTVDLAADGQEALDKLRAEPYDLVLLDIMMPVMDGYQTLEVMQGDDELRRIPVIMVSAVDEIKSVVRCIEAGAEDYLPKPFNPVLLRARVNASLEKKRLRDRERLYAKSLERDLEIGRDIQSGFFPERLPQPPQWEVTAYFQAARQVAGDFYDAFELADGNTIALVIADVCDKGVGAALFMALFRTLLRAVAHHGVLAPAGAATPTGHAAPVEEPAARLRHAVTLTNDYIATTHGSSNMFATIFFAFLDTRSGRMYFINAGHEPPLLLRQDGSHERLQPTGPAVGLFPELPFAVNVATFTPGDVLLGFTDGVTEARGADGTFYGEERLLALARDAGPGGAQFLLDQIAAELDAHVGGATQSDDITMIAVRRLP